MLKFTLKWKVSIHQITIEKLLANPNLAHKNPLKSFLVEEGEEGINLMVWFYLFCCSLLAERALAQSAGVSAVLAADQQLEQLLVVPALSALVAQLADQAAALNSLKAAALQDVRSESFARQWL